MSTLYTVTVESSGRTRHSFGRLEETFDDALRFARRLWNGCSPAERGKWDSISVASPESTTVVWTRPSLLDIPAGRYAFEGKRYVVTVPKAGSKWFGFVFVATGSEYHDRTTIAVVTPRGTFGVKTSARGEAVTNAIAADPIGRMAEFGQITGRCGRCGRVLEDADSIAAGLGPICQQKMAG
jgi:hypothetical protein